MTMFGESGYERQEDDFYRTPAWCTKALLDTLPWNLKSRYGNGIWEPAAGDGAIRDVLEDHGYYVYAFDINPRAERIEYRDFLTDTQPPWYTSMLITNPPYKHAEAFIHMAMAMARFRPRYPKNRKDWPRMVAMLLRNEFDSAASRKELFTGNVYFDTKIILTKRPRWIEGSTGSPRHNYAWFVWDFEREIGLRTPPTIRYAP